uniref:DNA (cytosine-5-)-methyltransferase n=1 Tax=Phalaenopsis aphrodite subsp. formosana TaxID=308872 RepID=A0A1D8DGS2_PHAAO|nr:domains rearranged methyltransferase 1 [Phalaenopsis aphrodite subsp. formosana]
MDGDSDIDSDFHWTDDDENKSPTNLYGEASEAGPSRPSLYSHFIAMGFSGDMVEKAIKENGEGDPEAILQILLNSSDAGKSPLRPGDATAERPVADDEDSSDDWHIDDKEDFIDDLPPKDRKLLLLVDMGYSPEDAAAAIDRCGHESTILELADSIHAAQIAEKSDEMEHYYPKPRFEAGEGSSRRLTTEKKKTNEPKQKLKKSSTPRTRKDHVRKPSPDLDDAKIIIPKPMVGFGLPNQTCITQRTLPDEAIGPPYFYYENIALTPKGVWETISRILYNIKPEFVDSKYFCAAARKRAYIHNLPIEGRHQLLPIPPKTIQEALPMTKQWWPKWDQRTQLNCLHTSIATIKITENITRALRDSGENPKASVRDYIIRECRKWNLVWIGHHRVAPLEPSEFEMLLGFPINHTRGGGTSRTERYKSLGNSFQVDTVAYHLSVLKKMFPDGINVLSLFSGIGGAEVALHNLRIFMKTVVSVEKSEINRNILRNFWRQTRQKGNLIDLEDVRQLDGDMIESLMKQYGPFDLVIGGSPCNNLTGSNRYTRDGLEGEHSSLFYDYFRVLDIVKSLMAKKR